MEFKFFPIIISLLQFPAKIVANRSALVSLILLTGCSGKIMNELRLKVPFVFSPTLNHKKVFTVGDQMLTEHVFAYHQNLSWKNGTQSLFSEIHPDYIQNTITIIQRNEIRDHTGKIFNIEELCQSVKTSFEGTLHAQYSSLVKEIICKSNEHKIIITFNKIPNNWQSLFASPDFAITDGKVFTGPYYIHSADKKSAHLKTNSFYPKNLRGNSIPDIYIDAYAANETEQVINSLNIEKDHATFLYGHVLSKKNIDQLREKKFNLQIFQSEWLVYIGFAQNVLMDDREKISEFIDSKRQGLKQFAELGTPAYSMAPTERAWGLNESVYNSLKKKIKKDQKIKKQYNIATLDEWAKLPLFSQILDLLQKNFDIKIKLFPRNEIAKIYDESDLFLSPMGVSPDDPIGHFYFFTGYSNEYAQVLNSKKELQNIAVIRDSLDFNNAIKELEIKAIQHKLLIPLFHYPSIVAESPQLKKDPKLSWDWGIQAWTYQIH